MDWYLDTSTTRNVTDLRHTFEDYLRRHAVPGSDLDGASLIFAELVTNALRHAGGPAWISLDWSETQPAITVHDLGPGFALEISEPELTDEGGRGLFIVSHLTDELRVASKRAGGTAVTATLPVHRETERTVKAPRRRVSALPAPEEAVDGTFSREPFLRALVVQLAQTVEEQQGPDAAEEAVTQVGTDVGSRIEDAWRSAERVVGRLDPDQMGDLYVRLKRAIQGDFYVIEANEDRIVLGNRACPFGEAVRRAPALCRMTSSVFGGIAARNRGKAAVQLEERIAVGDPECRVTVWLTDPPPEVAAFVHRYTAVED